MLAWERGRILSALQVVALTSGSGRIEWKQGSRDLQMGDAFLLPPGVWHRYRPDVATGWSECWLELRGSAVEFLQLGGLLLIEPVSMTGEDSFWRRFTEVLALCRKKEHGYRSVAAGLGFALVAAVVAKKQSADDTQPGRWTEGLQEAKRLLAEGREVRAVARELGLSYPTLHRQFTLSTGMGPKHYANQMRLARAEEYLVGTPLSVKEIAARLGYHSASHFSLDFKKARGMAPSQWQKTARAA